MGGADIHCCDRLQADRNLAIELGGAGRNAAAESAAPTRKPCGRYAGPLKQLVTIAR